VKCATVRVSSADISVRCPAASETSEIEVAVREAPLATPEMLSLTRMPPDSDLDRDG
jgi:hypothetical protein